MAACRKCNECINHRKRHWIGRMLAEEQTSLATRFVTFTYGGGYDNVDAYWINYKHLQLCFKRLRKAGHKFKYVSVGEHGGKFERAHFHVLFFWQNEPPKWELDERIHVKEWPHGHILCEKPRSQQGCAVYLMDYLNKDNLQKAVMKYSKFPMLGEEYLIEYAKKHARTGLGLFQNGDRFTIPNNRNKDGGLFYYPVGKQTAVYEKMLAAYVLEFALVRPDQKIPRNEIMDEFIEAIGQDIDKQPLVVQHYLQNHYGYEAVHDFQGDQYICFTAPNLVIKETPLYSQAIVYNNHGDEIWQGVLEAENHPAQKLRPNQLAEAVKRVAPTRTHRFIQT